MDKFLGFLRELPSTFGVGVVAAAYGGYLLGRGEKLWAFLCALLLFLDVIGEVVILIHKRHMDRVWKALEEEMKESKEENKETGRKLADALEKRDAAAKEAAEKSQGEKKGE